MKTVKVKCKTWKTKQTKTHLMQFQLFIFRKAPRLQRNFHGRPLSIRVFSADGHYLNNRVFLSRNYRQIVAPRKLDVLKTNQQNSTYASFKNINFQGETIRPRDGWMDAIDMD